MCDRASGARHRSRLPSSGRSTRPAAVAVALADDIEALYAGAGDAIDAARLIAKKQKHANVTLGDMERAIRDHVIPSELAKARTFESPAGRRKTNPTLSDRKGKTPATTFQRTGRQDFEGLKPSRIGGRGEAAPVVDVSTVCCRPLKEVNRIMLKLALKLLRSEK